MRINGLGTGSVEDRERSKVESAEKAPATDASQASVVVSPGTRDLSAAASRADAARAERVSAVRDKVQAGTYQVDRQKLAEGIADDELARAGRA